MSSSPIVSQNFTELARAGEEFRKKILGIQHYTEDGYFWGAFPGALSEGEWVRRQAQAGRGQGARPEALRDQQGAAEFQGSGGGEWPR